MMRQMLLAAVAALLFSSACGKIVIYGDSFSDDGHGANPVINAALSTDQMDVGIYPPAPYYKGRFSNGPTWIEVAAAALGQELTNLATGNAASGSVPGAFTVEPHFGYVNMPTMVPVPSSLQQSQSYVALHGGSINPNDIFIVFIGANDLVYTVQGVAQANASGIVNYIERTMAASYMGGARKFVAMNLPDLASLPIFSPPYTMGSASNAAMNTLTMMVPQVNSNLTSMLASFPTQYPGSTVMMFDNNALFANITSNMAAYGLTDDTTPCLNGPSFFNDLTGMYNYTMCSNPTEHMFWDVVHPTKAFHNIWGQAFVAELGPQLTANMGTPLPTSSV